MENKLQELTQKLYDEGLEKGRAEAGKLISDARAEAQKILAEAQAQADGIVRVIAWMRRSEFGSIKLCFDILMVTLAVESSLIMFHGLDGVREGTVVAMLLIGPLVRMLTRWMHAEPEIRNDSDQGSTGS